MLLGNRVLSRSTLRMRFGNNTSTLISWSNTAILNLLRLEDALHLKVNTDSTDNE